MFKRPKIDVGQRYREARRTAFGQPSQTVWTIQRVIEGCPLPHVRLADERDPSRIKMISSAALADRAQYVPLETDAGVAASTAPSHVPQRSPAR